MNEKSNSAQLLFTPQEAADALGISPRTLWSMTKNKAVPRMRLGRLWRYPVAQLDLWIEENMD